MKIVKAAIIHLILLFNLNFSQAQNCAFSKNETDKFTKDRIIYTEPIKINSEKIKIKKVYSIDKVEMQIKFENNSYFIYLSYKFGLGMSIANTNDKLVLLLADGVTIDAPCIQNMPDQRSKASGAAILSYNFRLSEDDFIKLTKIDIKDIRMTATINPVEFPISKDVMTSKLFSCISQNK
jgi:hypothetical protein